MEKRLIFKCNICGNVVELVQVGAPALVCCGEDMEELEVQTGDPETEKHVPVINKTNKGVEIAVGTTLHPMEDEHLIRFIEILTKDKVLRAELESGDEPKAEFAVDESDIIKVREFCNKHGLWQNQTN